MRKKFERKIAENSAPTWAKNISLSLLSDKWHRLLFLSITIVLMLVILFMFSNFSTKVTELLKEDTKDEILEVSLQSRNVLQEKLFDATSNLYGIAYSFSKYDDLNHPDIIDIMSRETVRNGYSHMGITTADGNSITNEGNTEYVADREYHKLAMTGIANISGVITSRITNEESIIYAVPILKDNEVVGVLRAVNNKEQLEKTMSVTSFNDRCYTYVCTNTGEVVFRPNFPESYPTYKNILDAVNLDEETSDSINDDVANKRSATKELKGKDGGELFASYAPLHGINDWYTVSVVPAEALLNQSNYIITLAAILLSVITVILGGVLLYVLYIRRSTQKTFEYLAFTDEITGGPSWVKFDMSFTNVIKRSKDRKYAFIYQNIQNFKYINDIMGHDIGNDLLKYISRVLSDNLSSDEIYTRIIADRFVYLIEYDNDASIIKKLEQINNEITLFRSNYNIDFTLNLFFGIYKIADKTLPLNIISDRALLALETLINSNDTNYGFYNSNIRQKVLLEKELENEMQSALDNKNFVVYLQPKFDLDKNEITGAEALVRWLHPKRGLIPPAEFIEMFENNGFITKLDLYVFEETCKLLRKWIDNGKEPIPISVNLSKIHLSNPNIAEDLYCLALRYNIPTKLIEIELTETMDFDNLSMLLSVVQKLKHFDFVISIDDFGTGYSSLNMLKDLPVDVLKIDRGFFTEAADQERGRKVIESIIEMAQRLDMKTVAEGVEYKEQADFLASAHCDYVQGFYFSHPICINDFEKKYIYNND